MTSASIFAYSDSRARIADWVELQVMLGYSGKCSSHDMVQAIKVIDDPLRDLDDEDLGEDPEDARDREGDRGILNELDENLSIRVYDELLYRAETLDHAYPFELTASGQRWMLRAKASASDEAVSLARSFYTAALYISGIKYEFIRVPEGHDALSYMPELMQVMSVVVAAEYVAGDAHWMGWPRPDETPQWLAAVAKFQARIQIGRLNDDNPAYDPAVVKDASVDVIAWRSFRDGKPGKAILYGQVASGKNWRSKALKTTFQPQFTGWFVNGPSYERLLSMFIPFMQHEDCKPKRGQVHDELAYQAATKDEGLFGIIFDRLRITELAVRAYRRVDELNASSEDDYWIHFTKLREWNEVVGEISGQRAA